MSIRLLSRVLSAGVAVALVTACSLDSLVRVDDPDQSRVIDRDQVHSLSGALGVYYNSVYTLGQAISPTTEDVGRITDELTYITEGSFSGATVDSRYSQRDVGLQSTYAYIRIQTARIQAGQAATMLIRFGSEREYPLVGHAYAIQGYAELLLAEVFCSGIPLTLVPFEGDLQYTRGFTTDEILRQAIGHFDTALSYAHDSAAIATMASVGKGRAYLNLGKYDSAALAVAEVPTAAKTVLQFSTAVNGGGFWTSTVTQTNNYRIVNGEGTSGLDWAAPTPALQDPRVPITTSGTAFTSPMRQSKFTSANVNMTIASGVEARLIEAEAALQPANAPQGDWLALINEARQTLPALSDTTDPGTADARIDLLFRERAFWFYLDGHRLGDLRRLVRQYKRPQQLVYPSGVYYSNGTGNFTYGTEVVFVPPPSEENLNYLYKGCINRDA